MIPVRVVGSLVPCPNYAKVSLLMDELVETIIHSQDNIITLVAYAHLQLAPIHPFVDGNGRTARLLMNLLLLQQHYPLIIIDAKDRKAYINAIQKAIQGDTADYYHFIYNAVDHSLDEYLKAIRE
jgi:Fic family protein